MARSAASPGPQVSISKIIGAIVPGWDRAAVAYEAGAETLLEHRGAGQRRQRRTVAAVRSRWNTARRRRSLQIGSVGHAPQSEVVRYGGERIPPSLTGFEESRRFAAEMSC